MKKIIIGLIGIFLVFFSSIIVNASVNSDWADSNNMAKYKQVDTEFRAVWVATVSNIDISKQKNKSDEAINEWKQNYLSILDNAEKYNLNAIIFQIRPCNDAFYPSKYNPWSEFLFAYGKDPGWDPLEWMIEVTHERGIEYHAWMNPYRASLTMSTSIVQSTGSSVRNVYDYDNDALQKSKHETFSDLKANCEKAYDGTDVDNPVFATGEELEHNVVMGTENKYVLNPASENTIEHLENTIREVVENYDIDGIHFDDYFYPTNIKKYKKVPAATRRQNVNVMVRKVYQTVKQKKKSLKFGISPAGDITYCEKIGADVRTWLSQSGYVDYIIPQIYWSNNYIMSGKKTALFNERLAKWREINKRDVPMYVGLALYKTGYSLKEDPGWKKSSGNIASQIRQIRSGNTEGYVFFAYKDLIRSGAAKELKKYYKEIGKISLNKKKKKLRTGKKYRLRASFWPANLHGKIKWKSSNKKIAGVSKKGVVKAKKKGTVRIYAIYGTMKKSCKIIVKKKRK